MSGQAKAAIFDLDGTLLNSLDDLADSVNEALATAGFPIHPVAAYRYFVGDGVYVLAERAAPAGTDEAVLKGLVDAIGKIYKERWHIKTKPYDGILAMLQELQQRGVPIAVLSNKPHSATQHAVSYFFPHVDFIRVQGSPIGGKAKPDPALALSIAQQMALPAQEICFVGDTRTDMQTATRAGMIPVGVLWGFRPESELMEHGAKIVLHTPEELLAHCKG